MKNKLFLLVFLSSNAMANVDLETSMKDVYGQTGVATYVVCDSNVNIVNRSNGVKSYTISTNICAQNKGCIENKSKIDISGGQKFKNSYYTVFTPVFNNAGTKTLECINRVNGAENESQIKNATAYIS